MMYSRPWMIQMITLVSLFYHELLSPSTVIAASTYNFVANQRPRFQIPRGNLSYYRSPQWEILYYLKFGVFPFYSNSSPYLNRTQYMNKMRLIKSLLDLKDGSTGAGAEHDISENDLAANFPHEDHHQLPDLEFMPTFPTGNSVEEDEKVYPSFYYPMTQIKKNSQTKTKVNDKRKDFLGKFESFKDEKIRKDTEAVDVDYFMVDGDPSWLRTRIPKESMRMSPGTQMFAANGEDGGSSLHGGGGGGIASEMTIERKVGRKFQTQGWKK